MLASSELKLSSNHGLHTIVHVLDEVLLGAAETTLVGDVEDAIASVGVLTGTATDLHIELIGDALEAGLVLRKLGEMDVDGRTESSAQVSGARGDEAQVAVVTEASTGLDRTGGAGKSVEDLLDVSTLLHRDDAELILLIDPDEERLLGVVEDASALGPVAVQAASFQEAVSLLEEEVVIDELALHLLGHTVKGVESSSEVTLEPAAGLNDSLHDFIALHVGDSWPEREIRQVAADTDPGRFDHGSLYLRERWAVESLGVHVRDVSVCGSVAVVLRDDAVKELFEGGVGILRTGVNTDARVDIFAAREDASLEGDSGSIDLVVVQLPHFLSQVLAQQRFGTLWELRPAHEVFWASQVCANECAFSSGAIDHSVRYFFSF